MASEVKFIVTAETRQAAANLQNFLGTLRGASGMLAKIAPQLVALTTVGGLVAFTRQALEAADAIGKASHAVGISVKEMGGLAFAAEQSDVSLDSLKIGLRAFSQELVKTGQGSRDVKEALIEQARLFSEMPDGAAKTTLAMQLFGRAGALMIPLLNEGADGMRELIERGKVLSGVDEKVAKTANDLNDAFAEMKFGARGLALVLATPLASGFLELTKEINETIFSVQKFLSLNPNAQVGLGDLAKEIVTGPAMRAVRGARLILSKIMGEKFQLPPGDTKPEIKEDTNRMTADQLRTERERASLDIGLQQVKTEHQLLGEKNSEIATIHRLADITEQLRIIDARRVLNASALNDKAITQAEADKLEIEDLTEINKLEADRIAIKVRQIENNFRLTEAEKYKQKRDAGVPADEMGADPGSFWQNIEANITKLKDQFGTFSQGAAALVTNGIGSAIQGVSDGIMGLIDGTKTWAQVWGSVLRSMAQQAIQFIVQQTAMFLLNKAKELLFHVTTETAKTTATVSNATIRTGATLGEAGAEAVNTGAKAAGSVASIPYVGWALAIAAFAGVIAMVAAASSNARALGGPVSAGQTYLVGERGPEFFHAPANGGILDNAGTMKVLSGGSKSSGGSTGGGDVNVKTIVVANIQAAMEEAMASARGTKIIVQTIGGSRLDLGLDT